MEPLLDPKVKCLPPWHRRFAALAAGRTYIIESGCGVDAAGNIGCEPEELRRHAERTLRTWGYWSVWRTLPLEVYTLARYIASEVGSGTVEERAAVGQAAINRVRRERLRDVNGLLLYRQPAGHPNRGRYGPIHQERAAPYGRWAATSRDPSLVDVLIADFLHREGARAWSRGADDQADITNTDYFPDPPAKVRSMGMQRSYWIGPLPGVDHRRTFLFVRRSDIHPESAPGQWLIARGIAATQTGSPDWSHLAVCSDHGWMLAAAVGLVGVGIALALSAPALRLPGGLGGRLSARSESP